MVFLILFILIGGVIFILSFTKIIIGIKDKIYCIVIASIIIILAIALPLKQRADISKLESTRNRVINNFETSENITEDDLYQCLNFNKILKEERKLHNNPIFGFSPIGISYNEIEYINVSDYLDINKK